MFGKNRVKNCIVLLFAAAFASLAISALAMTAYSITNKEIVEEGGKKFWQVRVTCTDLSTKRFIVQSLDEGMWCAKKLPDFCGASKIEAAVNVCGSDYRLSLGSRAAQEKENNENLAAQLDQKLSNKSLLLKEQSLIQSQRVELAQRKLDLRRRELDLQKLELDMLDKIDNLP